MPVIFTPDLPSFVGQHASRLAAVWRGRVESKVVHVVGCHAEEEGGDVIVGGVFPPPGETVWAQSRFITGCSARLATLHAMGVARVGDLFIGRSIIGSRFDCGIEAETTVGGRPAIVPFISGRAWITGTSQRMLDPADPWPTGYRLTDTWPLWTVG